MHQTLPRSVAEASLLRQPPGDGGAAETVQQDRGRRRQRLSHPDLQAHHGHPDEEIRRVFHGVYESRLRLDMPCRMV